jgi:hypothetical protein
MISPFVPNGFVGDRAIWNIIRLDYEASDAAKLIPILLAYLVGEISAQALAGLSYRKLLAGGQNASTIAQTWNPHQDGTP